MPAPTGVQWAQIFGAVTILAVAVGGVRTVDMGISKNSVRLAQVDEEASDNAEDIQRNDRRLNRHRDRIDDIAIKQGGVLGRLTGIDQSVKRIEDGQATIIQQLNRLLDPRISSEQNERGG